MSLSIPPQITTPFADAGLRTAIPASSNNVTGRAGYDQGFPPINMTAKVAGGIPPFGTDMNGILYAATQAIQFMESGMGFVYNAPFSTAIAGYNAGARVLRTDGRGYWLNTTNGNTTDPESAGGAAAGWVPDYTNGIAAVTMTNANVTLTPLQYGRPIIVITGTLVANVSLIFPAIANKWVVLNGTTGAFSITCRTAAGSGVVVTQGASASIYGDATNILFAAAPNTVSGFMLVRDEKPINTNGGSSVSGSNTRVLNTTVSNSIAGASLSSNQITLPLGTYRINAQAPAMDNGVHRIQLYNVTDSTTQALGTSRNGMVDLSDYASLSTRFTITATKVFELRHQIATAVATIGLGSATNMLGPEIYSEVEIIKES